MPTINHSTGTAHGLVYVKSRRSFGRIAGTVVYNRGIIKRHTIHMDDGSTIAAFDHDGDLACPDNVAVLGMPLRAMLRQLEPSDGPEAA